MVADSSPYGVTAFETNWTPTQEQTSASSASSYRFSVAKCLILLAWGSVILA